MDRSTQSLTAARMNALSESRRKALARMRSMSSAGVQFYSHFFIEDEIVQYTPTTSEEVVCENRRNITILADLTSAL
jgi:hypothetical protein